MITLFTGFLKSMVSTILAMSVSMTTALPGNMGEVAKIQAKAFEMDTTVTETVISLDLDVAAIETIIGEELGIPEIPGVYENGKLTGSMAVYSYGDLDELKAVISFGEDLTTSPAVFVDTDGFALNAPAVELAMTVASFVNEDYAKQLAVYKKYFPGEGFYMTWAEIIGADLGTQEIPAEAVELVNMVVTDVTAILTKEDNLKAFADLAAPIYTPMEKYYSETTVDGVKAYKEKMTFKNVLESSIEVSEISSSPEMMEGFFDYVKALADDIDYVKYIAIYNAIAPEENRLMLPDGVTNEMLVPFVLSSIDMAKTSIIEEYTAAQADMGNPYEVFEVILSGKDDSGEYAEVIEALPIITPIIENSYAETVIYEKNGTVINTQKCVITDGKTAYLTLDTATETKKYDGNILTPAQAVPFDKRVEAIELDNKMGYEDAIAKGVKSIDISWNSVMYPDDAELYIYTPAFYVNYKSSMIDSIINDPAFKAMDEETQKLLLGMYDETDSEFKYCDSSAELIDNSVYLPLRQIMENAGYEVSWDGEQRKAYVTVAGEKVEMTGVIVNDRTYVKIRDFEKLGATVEYSEEFYYENAYNDFDKECYATITFTK
ncbi:MAG: copper amine oxidase N-terminal domain-containing protein [Clostridia bacterium]|nr:copper amine oxidase N-terminal domain-containing protein [Clostridia bacterium]